MLRLLAFLMLPFVMLASAPAAAAPFKSDRLTVEVKGSGPDVVLIPGLSSSPRVWDTTVAALPGYRYHIVHVAGFDGLAPGANASGPVVAPVGEEIARYIAEARLRRPAIVGHSLGGSWAMMVAARHPELVSRVMVVDMMPFLGAIFMGPNATPEQLASMAAQIKQGMASSAGEERRKRTEQTIAGMVKTEAMRPVAVQQSLASDPAMAGQAMADLIVTDLRPELAKIKVPMTVLWVVPTGAPLSQEQLTSFYKASFANAPQTVLKYVPDSAHFIMWDNPTVFRAELKAFLSAK
jgi:pimeloyl-ACP methyl ester carboxylesterase